PTISVAHAISGGFATLVAIGGSEGAVHGMSRGGHPVDGGFAVAFIDAKRNIRRYSLRFICNYCV
ncbi:hypothetical protein II582_00745, partial [bacterium]|nr:hypothetical protein [bacterium]